jgi:hypothetical protein
MIYITNAIYLAQQQVTESNRNKPFIGYNSMFAPSGIVLGDNFSVHAYGTEFNMWSPDTYTHFNSGMMGGTYNIDFLNADGTVVNYFTIVGHNMTDYNYSYSLSYFDGDDFVLLVDNKTPVNNNTIIEYFDDITTTIMRLTIHAHYGGELPTPPTDSFLRIAHVKTGWGFFLQRRPYVGVKPLGMDAVYDGVENVSDNGNYLGSYATSESLRWEIKQEYNTPDFVREKILPFINHLNGINSEIMSGPPMTFVHAWRPDDYPSETMYCWKPLRARVAPENSMRNGMMSWDAEGKGLR